MPSPNSRYARGAQILVKRNQIRRLGFGNYEVRSQSRRGSWYVVSEHRKRGWTCTCNDFARKLVVCKHIYAVMLLLRPERSISNAVVSSFVPLSQELLCPSCHSIEVVRDGRRKTSRGVTQRFTCKLCSYRFVHESAFIKTKSTPEAITASIDLYFKGCSLHKIQDHLAQFYDVHVSHVAVLKWVRKYTDLMKRYTDGLVPDAATFWHVDEMMVRVKRADPEKLASSSKLVRYTWLWNLIDRETRFLLASQIHKRRNIPSARLVFKEGKMIAGGKPLAIVHDGAGFYDEAYRREFYTNTRPVVSNVRSLGITKLGRNHIVERFNGSVRDREKAMRGMHSDESAQRVMDGNRVIYNFLRPHMALSGRTPAQTAGIELDLKGNRVRMLIEMSAQALKGRKRA